MVVLAPVGIGAYGIKHLGQSVQTNDHAPPTTNMVLEIIAILTAIVVLCFAADRVGTYFVPEGDYRIITHLVLFLVIADSSIGRGVRKIVQWGVGDTVSEGMTDIQESTKPPNPVQPAIVTHPQQTINPNVGQRPIATNMPPQTSNSNQMRNEMETIVSRVNEPVSANEFSGGGGSLW